MPRSKTTKPEGYDERREQIRAAVAERGRGAQMQASYDLRVPPIIISRTLTGKIVRPDVLERLGVWAAGDPEP